MDEETAIALRILRGEEIFILDTSKDVFEVSLVSSAKIPQDRSVLSFKQVLNLTGALGVDIEEFDEKMLYVIALLKKFIEAYSFIKGDFGWAFGIGAGANSCCIIQLPGGAARVFHTLALKRLKDARGADGTGYIDASMLLIDKYAPNKDIGVTENLIERLVKLQDPNTPGTLPKVSISFGDKLHHIYLQNLLETGRLLDALEMLRGDPSLLDMVAVFY